MIYPFRIGRQPQPPLFTGGAAGIIKKPGKMHFFFFMQAFYALMDLPIADSKY